MGGIICYDTSIIRAYGLKFNGCLAKNERKGNRLLYGSRSSVYLVYVTQFPISTPEFDPDFYACLSLSSALTYHPLSDRSLVFHLLMHIVL